MEIELYSLLSTVIVLVFLFTVIFAIYCYIAFRVRQRASLRHSSINSRPRRLWPWRSQSFLSRSILSS